jgi:sulfite reductase alpha subunit-like flavoprotein
MLSDGFLYTVLGLGNSNLLLDRQTTGPNDCNQVAQELDQCLYNLGGSRWYPLGLADERIGLDINVEPWIDGLWQALNNKT